MCIRDRCRSICDRKRYIQKTGKCLCQKLSLIHILNNAAAESSVLSTYIETLLGLPWNKKSEDSTDLKEAWKILEEGHYGLKDVKERIMEFLAVRKLTSGGKSPILCLVGPCLLYTSRCV